jgi:hypothetical protein
MSTTTVSVRDGWLTVRQDYEGAPRCMAAQVPHISKILDMFEDLTACEKKLCATIDGWPVPGVRTAEIMEIIHAGSGTLVREVP